MRGRYPGLDFFTSQSNFWGSHPTTFLTENVSGFISTASAYSQFLFAALPDFLTIWVHDRVSTPEGIIYAACSYNSAGKLS